MESFLKDARLARLCSFNKDGTVHAAPVWFVYENGRITMGAPARSRKARNIRRNGSVTVLVDIEGPPKRRVIV